MMAWRAWREARGRHLAARQREWGAALERALADPAAALPRVAWLDLPHFLFFAAAFRAGLDTRAAEALAAFARGHGLDARALALLRSPRLRPRLAAIATVGWLREERAWPQLAALAHGRNPAMSLAAARALVAIDPRRGLELVAPAMVARDDWPLARVAAVLAALGRATVTPPLLTQLVARPRRGRHRVMQLARFGERARVAPVVRGWLTAEDPEVKLAALDYLDQPEDLPWARAAVDHPDWRVRMGAARALGRIGAFAELEPLLALLRDPVWWVRYHAAHALARLPGLEPRELDSLREDLRDAYAAEMLAHALAERGRRA